MARPQQDATARANRILDAVVRLLLRHGYAKVTIDDVAKHASVGKGTVYLHWRTRDQMFTAAVAREAAEVAEELATPLRRDPARALPHRYIGDSYLAMMRRPLLLAAFAHDSDLLGRVLDSPVYQVDLSVADDIFGTMLKHRLLRGDIPDVTRALQAVMLGFILMNGPGAQSAGPDIEVTAKQLTHTVRAAFEPPGEPDPGAVEAAAVEVIALNDKANDRFRDLIHPPATKE